MKNRLVRKVFTAMLAGGLTGGLASLGAASILVDKLTRNSPPTFEELYAFTPFETHADYEDIEFPTVNNRMLKGWWLPQPNSKQVVICVSGYRGKKEDLLGISAYLWRANYNVLLFDFRAQGLSRVEEELLTLGHFELEDMQSAISYVRKRVEGARIALIGGSMGASVCLMAAARDPEIKGVWSDSAFTSQEFVISYTWRNVVKIPPYPVIPLAERFFARQTGYKWSDFAPINEVAKLGSRPVYFVHSADDVTVPVECAYQLYNAKPGPKELWIDSGVGHCGVYFKSRVEYSQRVLKFMNDILLDEPSVSPTAPEGEPTEGSPQPTEVLCDSRFSPVK